MKWFGLVLALMASPLAAQSVNFGDDGGEYSNDGECDDPRFEGFGMASTLSEDDIQADATDCRFFFEKGTIYFIDETAARAATQCDAIDFGNNTSEWANDGECDDRRFSGPGAAGSLAMADSFRDAKDCRRQCNRGRIYLRIYK